MKTQIVPTVSNLTFDLLEKDPNKPSIPITVSLGILKDVNVIGTFLIIL